MAPSTSTSNGKASNGVQHKPLQNDDSYMDIPRSDTICGCGPFKPACLQIFTRPVVFTGHLGLVLAVFLCAITYFSGIITTIERQFQLSSSEVAALSVINDVVSLSLVIVVTYFGDQSHRPRWIACGAILVSVSFIFCALPHYLSDPIDPTKLTSGNTGSSANSQAQQMSGVCNIDSNIAGDMYRNVSHNSSIDACAEASNEKGMGPVKWLVIGQVIMGVASAPMFPLGLSYIDDAVPAHKFTSYSAFLFIAVLLGPMLGFFSAATATSFYVDFDRIPADQIPDIHQYDPRWIGAWWLGFPLFAIMLFVAALPMFLYPKVMISKKAQSCAEDNKPQNFSKADEAKEDEEMSMNPGKIFKKGVGLQEAIKGIFLAIKRLIFNLPLMLLFVASIAETAIGVIQSTFQVKYYQTQFGTSPANAAKLMGGIFIPCLCVGQVVSAVICRVFKFDIKQCTIFIFVCHFITLFIGIASFFVGCSSAPVAGLNTAYSTSYPYATMEPDFLSTTAQIPLIDDVQLENACNRDCSCPDEIFQPVCGANGISYISPCHAGCTEAVTRNNSKTYTGCSCISSVDYLGADNGGVEDTAVDGLCWEHCNSDQQLLIIMVVGVFGAFIMSLTWNPTMFVIFRLVGKTDRSVALGLQSVVTKCLGYFPSPIIMGILINATCTLWQYTCGDRGACWLYDNLWYRYLFVGVSAGLKIISVIAYLALTCSIKSTKNDDYLKVDEKELEELSKLKESTV